jgi:hypothetical protein
MTSMKALAIAIGVAFAASSFALAQQGSPPNPQGNPANQQANPANQQANPANQPGNPANNAAASGGSGTHQTAQKTGSAANTQKVRGNHNGYRRLSAHHTRRVAARRPRRIFAYQMSPRCRQLLRLGRPLPRSCRI